MMKKGMLASLIIGGLIVAVPLQSRAESVKNILQDVFRLMREAEEEKDFHKKKLVFRDADKKIRALSKEGDKGEYMKKILEIMTVSRDGLGKTMPGSFYECMNSPASSCLKTMSLYYARGGAKGLILRIMGAFSQKGLVDKEKIVNGMLDVANIFAHMGEREESSRIVKEAYALIMEDDVVFDGIRKDVALKRVVNVQSSLHLIDDALKTSGYIKEDGKREDAIKRIIRAAIKKGGIDLAKEVAGTEEFALSGLATQMAKRGMVEESLNIAEKMKDGFDKWRIISEVVKVYADNGMEDKSISLIKRYNNNPGYKRYFANRDLFYVGTSLIISGNLAKGQDMIRSIKEDDLIIASGRYREGAERLFNAGLEKLSIDFINESLKNLKLTHGRPSSGFHENVIDGGLMEIAELLAKMGRYDDAFRVADKIRMKYADLKVFAIAKIAKIAWESGEYRIASRYMNKAFRLARRLKYDPAILMVASTYLEMGNIEEAESAASYISRKEKDSFKARLAIVRAMMMGGAMRAAFNVDDVYKRALALAIYAMRMAE